MNAISAAVASLKPHVHRARMVDTALALLRVPSRTGEAGAVLDALAAILRADGFTVERPAGGHQSAPAVAVRFDSGRPGPTLQFNGHLDTVHLPFVAPEESDGRLTGSGSADMKGGTVAALEALRAIRDAGTLQAGSILFTAHDLHESPWGDGHQLDNLIREGYVGDAVLLPEPLTDHLPVVGRGLAVWKLAFRRAGAPVHEVMRPPTEPSVIAAAGDWILELTRLAETLRNSSHDHPARQGAIDPGPPSAFIGQVHSGEIYNQYPQVARLEGTRRWLPGTDRNDVERELRALAAEVAGRWGVSDELDWVFTRDAFQLDLDHRVVSTFQDLFRATSSSGQALPLGPKPFVDDGNSFWALADVPAITHGPRAAGAHTLHEWVDIDDMMRVAWLYAATAAAFCNPA